MRETGKTILFGSKTTGQRPSRSPSPGYRPGDPLPPQRFRQFQGVAVQLPPQRTMRPSRIPRAMPWAGRTEPRWGKSVKRDSPIFARAKIGTVPPLAPPAGAAGRVACRRGRRSDLRGGPLRRRRTEIHQRRARAYRLRHAGGDRPAEGRADGRGGQKARRISPAIAGAGESGRPPAAIPGGVPRAAAANSGRSPRGDAGLRRAVGPGPRSGPAGQHDHGRLSRRLRLLLAHRGRRPQCHRRPIVRPQPRLLQPGRARQVQPGDRVPAQGEARLCVGRFSRFVRLPVGHERRGAFAGGSRSVLFPRRRGDVQSQGRALHVLRSGEFSKSARRWKRPKRCSAPRRAPRS